MEDPNEFPKLVREGEREVAGHLKNSKTFFKKDGITSISRFAIDFANFVMLAPLTLLFEFLKGTTVQNYDIGLKVPIKIIS